METFKIIVSVLSVIGFGCLMFLCYRNHKERQSEHRKIIERIRARPIKKYTKTGE